MIDTAKFFKEKKYVLIKEMIPKDIAKVATQYSHYDRALNFQPEAEGAQIPGSHSVYGDPLMETLLNFGRKTIEKSTGLELWPTYSYYRLYKVGDMLKRHKDRPSCEVSITCCLGYDYKGKEDYNWGMFVGPEDGERGAKGKMIPMEPGDGVIYRGCEVEHWREAFNAPMGAWQTQVFLHYVDKNGPYGDFCKFDSRPALGLPHTTKDMDKVKAANDVDKNALYRQKDIDFPELNKEEVPYENREEK